MHTRRRCSYSLRTLFVALTVTAFGVGWAAYERRQSKCEMQIAEQLQAKGVYLTTTGLFDPVLQWDAAKLFEEPSWWRRGLSALCGPRVQMLAVGPDSLLAEDITPVAEFKSLQALNLDDTRVSDLSPLAGLKNLKELWLRRTQISDLLPIAGLNSLERLSLQETNVGSVSPLAGLKKLQVISISGTKVSDLAPLTGLMNLRVLHIRGTPVTEKQIKLLQEARQSAKSSPTLMRVLLLQPRHNRTEAFSTPLK